MTQSQIRILLVDKYEIVLHGLAKHIATHEDMLVVGEATDGDEAIALCGKTNPDVVVVDLNPPGIDSVELTRSITTLYPKIRVIVMTLFIDEKKRKVVLDAGGFCYLLKGNPIGELLSSIRYSNLTKPKSIDL